MAQELSAEVVKKVRSFVECNPDVNVVTVILRDGRKIPNVMIYGCSEIVGNAKRDFSESDIVDVIHQPWGRPPVENKWWEEGNTDWWKK